MSTLKANRYENTASSAGGINIDSSGKIGINEASPSAIAHIKGAGGAASGNELLRLETEQATGGGWISFNDASARKGYMGYKETGNDGIHIVNEENSFLALGTNGSERARLDSSGRLLIGTTSAREHLNDGSDSAQVFVQGTTQNTSTLAVIRSSDNDGPSHLVLGKARGTGSGSTTVVQSGDTIGHINFEAADGSHLIRAGQISCVVDGTPGANDMPGRLKFSTCPNGSNSLVRRMEISNQGRLDIFASGATDAHFISSAASAGTAVEFIKCMHSASSIGSGTTALVIHTNGNVENTNNSYGSISDVKLKENIADASSQWDDIKGIQVRNYNFKEDTGHPTHTQIGVVAQEVETVSPGLVYETPDKDDDGTDLGTVTKSVNYSVLYMKSVKALQEAMTRIETLEAKVAALEAA